jgi:signal transduction histidine kinase
MAEQERLADPIGSFRRLSEVGQQALKEMRLMIHQLRPPILEDVGLVAALRQRLEAVEQRANVEARLVTGEEGVHLPQPIEDHLFHIAQEALNNALRHAAATEVIVRIEADGNEVLLSVEDNGTGFDPGLDSAGMGMTTMQERAEAIGGQITVNSVPGQSTTVEVTVALEQGEGV